MIHSALSIILALSALGASTSAQASTTEPTDIAAYIESLPWETNDNQPFIGDPQRARRGGEINLSIGSYPRTFRLFGPNSNEAFASFNRSFASDFSTVWRHPITDEYVPVLATHWAIMPDNKTVYYRLREDVRWSDGTPVTADDYVFAFEMLTSPYIVDPFAMDFMDRFFEGVDRLDDFTIRIRGKIETWRPLSDYSFSPLPRHAVTLNEGWVADTNYKPNVVVGPYVISNFRRGESITFERVENWWGDDKHLFQGLFNFDRINLIVIQDESRMTDFFRAGRLDILPIFRAAQWAREIDQIPEIENGYAIAREVYVEFPEGLYGIGMNLQTPLLQNRDFRKALQYLFHFDLINERLMFNAYFRGRSFFEGTEFESPNVYQFRFDPAMARHHLAAAGFTRRDRTGILVNEQGQRARFTVTFASRGLERHLTVIQNIYRRAGVDMQLRLFEPSTAFQRIREKTTEAFVVSMTSGFFPSPRQFFHSSFADQPQTNNFFAFRNEEVDKLIDIYEKSQDAEARLAAMHRLDELLTEEAFFIHFWSVPFIRLAHWRWIEFPEFYFPRRTQQVTDHWVMWVNEEMRAEVQQAQRERRALPDEESRIVDFWGIRPEDAP